MKFRVISVTPTLSQLLLTFKTVRWKNVNELLEVLRVIHKVLITGAFGTCYIPTLRVIYIYLYLYIYIYNILKHKNLLKLHLHI